MIRQMVMRLANLIAPPPKPRPPSDREKELSERVHRSIENVQREIVVMDAIRRSMERDDDRERNHNVDRMFTEE